MIAKKPNRAPWREHQKKSLLKARRGKHGTTTCGEYLGISLKVVPRLLVSLHYFKWLAVYAEEDLFKFILSPHPAAPLAPAVKALTLTSNSPKCITVCRQVFPGASLEVQEAILDVLFYLDTEDGAILFLKEIAKSAKGDPNILDIAREMVEERS